MHETLDLYVLFLASVFLDFVLNQSYSHVLLSRFKDSTLVTTCELRSVA